jgi:hypothetical protein
VKRLLSRIVLLFIAGAVPLACTDKPHEYTTNVADTGRQVLDTPFHFLLSVMEYPPERLVHQADMSSAWGHLVLARKEEGSPPVVDVRAKLLEIAQLQGWEATDHLDDIEQPDLARYGMKSRSEDLTLMLTKGEEKPGPPTRYGCRVWIAHDGRRVVVAYRVDGE